MCAVFCALCLAQVTLPAGDLAVYMFPLTGDAAAPAGQCCLVRVPQVVSSRRGHFRVTAGPGSWRSYLPQRLVPFTDLTTGWQGAMMRSERPVWVLDGGSSSLPRVVDFILPRQRRGEPTGEAFRAQGPRACPITCFTPFSTGDTQFVFSHGGLLLFAALPDSDGMWLHGTMVASRVAVGHTVHRVAYLDEISGGSRVAVEPLYAVATSSPVRLGCSVCVCVCACVCVCVSGCGCGCVRVCVWISWAHVQERACGGRMVGHSG